VTTLALADQIPHVAQITDLALREAVLATWAESLERSPNDSLDDVPQSPVMPGRSLLLHVNEVNAITVDMLVHATDRFGLSADADVILATAILHDVDKPLLYRRDARGEFEQAPGTELKDHGRVGAELAARNGVPDLIVGMVRTHSPFASEGLPGNVDGTVVHYADMLANDLASVVMGVVPIHANTRPVPRAG
jgi:putative nucleotidyltransferase with HDIG domain